MAAKIIACADCGTDFQRRAPNQLRCQDCAREREKARWKRNSAKRWKRVNAGREPKFRPGTRICERCQVRKPHAEYNTRHGRICRTCKSETLAVSTGIPKEWKVPYQQESDPLRREIQECAASDCYVCLWLKQCRANVARIEYALPCEVER